jgi:hypothetical protein
MKTLKTSNLSVAQYQEVLTRDLYAFVQKSFTHLNPRTTFLPNWHIEVIAAKLEACRRGKIKRLIICVPPSRMRKKPTGHEFLGADVAISGVVGELSG